MGVLQRFERRIEDLVNRPFARAFKSEVQPVEIASALQRECDDRAAIVARGRTMVPNTFIVELGEHDHERLSPYAAPLGAELSDMVREHAQEQNYSFIGPVTVAFDLVEDLSTGMFRVRSSAIAGAVSADPQRRTSARAPFLEVNGTRFPLTDRATVIGRGTEVDLRIDDPGISRRHAQVELRRNADDEGSDQTQITVVDLGSTNGIVVGGQRADRVRLRDGEEFLVGSTTVVFHAGGAGDA